MLRHGIHSITLQRVENRTGVVGIEGPVRRKLETRLIDYLDQPYPVQRGCKTIGSSVVFHGMNQELKFVDQEEARLNKVDCNSLKHQTDLIVRILNITLQPTSFVEGGGVGQSFKLQKNSLLVSTYNITTMVQLEFLSTGQEVTAPGSYRKTSYKKTLYKANYSYVFSMSASVNLSDLTGASKNYIRNQLFLVENMERIAEFISENVFNDLTTVF